MDQLETKMILCWEPLKSIDWIKHGRSFSDVTHPFLESHFKAQRVPDSAKLAAISKMSKDVDRGRSINESNSLFM